MEVLQSLSNMGDFVAYYKGGVEHAFRACHLVIPIE